MPYEDSEGPDQGPSSEPTELYNTVENIDKLKIP